MKKIMTTIVLGIYILAILSGCGQSIIPVSSSQSSSTTSSTSISSSLSSSISSTTSSQSKTPMEEKIDYYYEHYDIPKYFSTPEEAQEDMMQRDQEYEENGGEYFKYYDIESMIDNESPLSELIKLNEKELNEKETWTNAQAAALIKYPGNGDPGSAVDISFFERNIKSEVKFVRGPVSKDMDPIIHKEFWRCYTVFKSEIGGYVYMYFHYYPDIEEGQNTVLTQANYVPVPISTSDFDDIEAEESTIDDVLEITPLPKYLFMGFEWGNRYLHTWALCEEGLAEIYFTALNGEMDPDVPRRYNGQDIVPDKVLSIKINPDWKTSAVEHEWYAEYQWDWELLPGDYWPE